MQGIMAMVLRQVIYGAAMAAGQAVIETGTELTIEALNKKLSDWGVVFPSDSVMARMLDNFKGQIGMQASMEIMKHSDNLYESYLNQINLTQNERVGRIKQNLSSKYQKLKNNPKKKYFNVPFLGEEAIIKKAGDLAMDSSSKKHQTEISNFKEMKTVSSGMYTGLAVGTGTINTASNTYMASSHNDDSKLFDVVMSLMNMKKVG